MHDGSQKKANTSDDVAPSSRIVNVLGAVSSIITIGTFIWAHDIFFKLLSFILGGWVAYLWWINRRIRREHILLRRHSAQDISDTELFKRFYETEINRIGNRLFQLKNGYLLMFGDEVRQTLDKFFLYLESPDKKNIRSVDLTSNPELLLKRSSFLKSNEAFIKKGGIVRRIFVVEKNSLSSHEFLFSLFQIMETTRYFGVPIGLYFSDFLESDEQQDFIVYDQFAAIVEGKQATEDYRVATSNIYFTKEHIDLYVGLFEKMWTPGTNPSAPEIQQLFDRYSNQLPDKELDTWKKFPVKVFLDEVDHL